MIKAVFSYLKNFKFKGNGEINISQMSSEPKVCLMFFGRVILCVCFRTKHQTRPRVYHLWTNSRFLCQYSLPFFGSAWIFLINK